MSDVLYLAWRYLAYHTVKTAILVASITLILFLPVGLRVLVRQSADALTVRAQATPLIVGAKGSPLELVLNSLYFESDAPEAIPFSASARVAESGLATAIPLHTGFSARGFPIVATTLDYFEFREMQVASGRLMAMLGECVIGSEVAVRLGIGVDDSLVSSPESVFDIAGVYPLKMNVVGVLRAADSPDDRGIFVDSKTAWIIAGLAHGHDDLAKPELAAGVLKREGDTITANASVVQYNEITPENVDTFHFHGDVSAFPVTAVIAVPRDEKSGTLLQGRYVGKSESVQIVRPATVMDELLKTILAVQSYVVMAVVVVGTATFGTAILVFLLSLKLRQREIQTMHRIGGSKTRVVGILAAEVVVVLLISVVLAAGLTAVTSQFGATLIRAIIL